MIGRRPTDGAPDDRQMSEGQPHDCAPARAQNGEWARVRGQLREEVGEDTFRSWFKGLALATSADGEVWIAAPSRFVRDWVRDHYGERIAALWQTENPAIRAVRICFVGEPGVAIPTPPATDAQGTASGAAAPNAHGGANAGAHVSAQSFKQPGAPTGFAAPWPSPFHAGIGAGEDYPDFGAPLDPRFTFENFVVGSPNELAFAAARRVAEADAVPFNPLFLYGGVGLGKTHLMHAIAWHIRRRNPGRRVVYLSAEKFMFLFIRALRFKDTMAFKEQFRSVDVLMIDDVQFIIGKESTQEEFFHTFNALVDQNRQVVISADKSPADLEGMEERLRSRLGWGLVADIHPTTYELRLGILQAKAEMLQVPVPPKVVEFLAHRISANVRELEGALNRIAAHAQLVGRSITLENTQEALQDLLRANDRRVTIEEIQKRVAEHFNIRLADMHSERRARAVARPRQVAMYLAKQLTQRSLPEIGRKFGGRDHTTVMHAVRRIEHLLATDGSFAEDVHVLRRMLEN